MASSSERILPGVNVGTGEGEGEGVPESFGESGMFSMVDVT
jgi:hypothetical protein